jgi:hypothetical protein
VEASDLSEATASTIFSLEVKGLALTVRDWLDKINLSLEQGLKPEEDLLHKNLAL